MADIELNIEEDDLEGILDEGDPDAIATALGTDAEEKLESKNEAEPKNIEDVESESSSAQVPDSDEAQGDILTKNGQHTIPYAVLERARIRLSKTQDELSEARQKLSNLEGNNSQLSKALEEHGVDIESIQAGSTLSDDQIAVIAEESPQIANVITALQNQVKNLYQQVEVGSEANSVEIAIQNNTDLASWRGGDPARWEIAVDIDDELRTNPDWSDKPLDERFDEAARRTKELFGDALPKTTRQDPKEIVAQKLAKAQQGSLPTSLTDLGQPQQVEKTKAERLLEASDPEDVFSKMENMSSDQIEDLLNQIEY